MQLVAEFIEFLIAPPRFQAASAIPVPTMARIKAYSAADAPLWSAHRLFKKVISFTPTRWERFPVALAQLHGRGLSTSRPRRRYAPIARQLAVPVELAIKLKQS